MPTAPPLGRILAELLGGTRSSPPEAPSRNAVRATVGTSKGNVWDHQTITGTVPYISPLKKMLQCVGMTGILVKNA